MSLKAGVVQFSPLYGRVEDNLERLESLVETGANQGAEILVLPEMAWTGYLWPKKHTLLPRAEQAGSGPGQDRMRELSRRWNLTLLYGFPERGQGGLFNAQGLAAPDGTLGPVYRKTHLFDADTWWALPGDTGYLQWASAWGAIGSGICMDLNFPDLSDFHTEAGTEILAFSTNWIDQNFDVLPYWAERLRGSQGPGFQRLALFANRGASEFGVPFRGQSAIFWEGECLASLPGKEDGVLVAEVPLEATTAAFPGR